MGAIALSYLSSATVTTVVLKILKMREDEKAIGGAGHGDSYNPSTWKIWADEHRV